MGDTSVLRELYEARRLDEAWGEYERLRAEGPLGADGHLYGALTARLLSDYPSARRCLERSEIAKPTGNTLGKLRLLTGNVLREIGDYSAAIGYYQAYIDGVGSYPETIPVCLGAAYYNLGLAYRSTKRLGDALSCYELACDEFRRNDFPDYLRQALQNIAWSCCLSGDLPRAEAALNEAEDLCKTDSARWHQRIGWALLESLTGTLHSSLKCCEEIVNRADSLPPSLVSHACWLAGRVALSLGQAEQASTMAQQAVEWSLRVKGDLRPMQDANSLRREIHIAMVDKQAGA